MIRALRRQRVEHVDDADDLRQQRHFGVAQAVRIAAAVESLVMMADDRPDVVERSETRRTGRRRRPGARA